MSSTQPPLPDRCTAKGGNSCTCTANTCRTPPPPSVRCCWLPRVGRGARKQCRWVAVGACACVCACMWCVYVVCSVWCVCGWGWGVRSKLAPVVLRTHSCPPRQTSKQGAHLPAAPGGSQTNTSCPAKARPMGRPRQQHSAIATGRSSSLARATMHYYAAACIDAACIVVAAAALQSCSVLQPCPSTHREEAGVDVLLRVLPATLRAVLPELEHPVHSCTHTQQPRRQGPGQQGWNA